MKITYGTKQTVELRDLLLGDVFVFPKQRETLYMVINEHDYYIDSNVVKDDEVVYIGLADGGIYSSDGSCEVIEISGSFVID